MKVIIVGAGAVGSLLGGLLSKEHEVHLLGRGAHVRAIMEGGLRVEGMTAAHLCIAATDDPGALPRDADLLVFTVKAYDTIEAARSVRGVPAAGTPVLSLQNGMGNVEALVSAFGAGPVVAGITVIAVNRPAPGVVIHAAPGRAVVGRSEGEPDGTVERVASALSAALPVTTSANMVGEIFLKAIANAAINGLTALHRVRNGVLMERQDLMAEMDAIVAEAELVARAHRIVLPVDDVREHVHDIVRMTAANVSSMLQDVESRRRTEVDFINGAISRMGWASGVPTPRNDMVVAAIRRIEAGYTASRAERRT
ncbi:MAG: 2-dehydropantoate 2-reductase [Thermoplasmata archaeon]|nr:2-dehydropantoate 2-reductase [Thermoplasmata archaeon]